MQRYTVYFIWKLLYMFRVVPSPIIRSANNYIYSYLYPAVIAICCYCGRGGTGLSVLWVAYSPPTAHSAADSNNGGTPDAVDRVLCPPDDW